MSDESKGVIYVIDINRASNTFDTLVRTINVGPALSACGGLDLNTDGSRLFVAAPIDPNSFFDRDFVATGNGNIFVVSVDTNNKIWRQVDTIKTGHTRTVSDGDGKT